MLLVNYSKTILLIGTFDSKAEEYTYLEKLIMHRGHKIVKMDIGVIGNSRLAGINISAQQVAEIGGESLEELRNRGDRGHAMTIMSRGAAKLVRTLHDKGDFDGIIGMGGSGGSSVISTAMRNLPIGVPKVLVSTIASGDTRPLLGTSDITLIPSLVDIAGINRISSKIIIQAVGSICGMVEMESDLYEEGRPIVAVTMFGNTTPCADRCRSKLIELGYEVLVFHCTGIGGQMMERLIEDGLVDAVLDITTTEWADQICGGIFAAGPSRLEAAGKRGVPHLIVPGCVDMVNFGARESVPDKYKDRKFNTWNPNITLMRTTPEENRRMGKIFAKKANHALGPIAFLLPLKGVSLLDSVGNEFWWPEANQAMFNEIKQHSIDRILIEEMDANINDPAFADQAVEMLMSMIRGGEVHGN